MREKKTKCDWVKEWKQTRHWNTKMYILPCGKLFPKQKFFLSHVCHELLFSFINPHRSNFLLQFLCFLIYFIILYLFIYLLRIKAFWILFSLNLIEIELDWFRFFAWINVLVETLIVRVSSICISLGVWFVDLCLPLVSQWRNDRNSTRRPLKSARLFSSHLKPLKKCCLMSNILLKVMIPWSHVARIMYLYYVSVCFTTF